MLTVTLTTLTPVHIGSGQTLKKGFDFLLEGNKVGFMDLDKIVSFIGEDYISQLSASIERGESLGTFLREGRGFKHLELKDISSRIADGVYLSPTVAELKEQYHTSIKGACIPGSSLKGAIKTAIWDSLTNDDFFNSLQSKDFGFLNQKKVVEKWKDATIEKKLFGPNANEKSTRFLKIGDCHFEATSTQVHEVGIYNAYRGGYWDFKKGNNFLAEVIPAKASAQLEIKIDEQLLQRNTSRYHEKWERTNTDFVSNGFAGLCQLINSYTKNLLDWEFEDLETNGFDKEEAGENMLDNLNIIYKSIDAIEQKKCNEAILRIGGNCGWKFTTSGWITKENAPLSEDDFYQLRKAIQKRDYSEMNFWPKTRKMTMQGVPLGFVKISFNQ